MWPCIKMTKLLEWLIDKGRFPFNNSKKRFKILEFLLVKWDGSLTVSHVDWSQGMLGCFKMADVLNVFAAFEDNSETLSYCIIDSDQGQGYNSSGQSYLFYAKKLKSFINGYFEVTTLLTCRREFPSLFRLTREACVLLAQEIMDTSGRHAFVPQK